MQTGGVRVWCCLTRQVAACGSPAISTRRCSYRDRSDFRDPQAEELLYDPPGIVRASIGWINFERLLDAAYEQIRMYSKTDVAVSLRLLRAMGDIATSTPDPEFRRIPAERLADATSV